VAAFGLESTGKRGFVGLNGERFNLIESKLENNKKTVKEGRLL